MANVMLAAIGRGLRPPLARYPAQLATLDVLRLARFTARPSGALYGSTARQTHTTAGGHEDVTGNGGRRGHWTSLTVGAALLGTLGT